MATLTLPPPLNNFSSSSDLTNLTSQEKKVIVDKAEAIATYYIPYHLRRTVEHCKLQGLPKHYLIPPQQPAELYVFIANICTQVEAENSDFFNGLPESMNLQANNAKSVYIALCKTVFADEVINWGRVMSIFTLAASLAVYFTRKGQLSLVTKIPHWLGEVIESELADWVIEQGGWDDVKNKLSPKADAPRWQRMIAYGGVIAVTGFFMFRNSGNLL